MCSFVQLEKLHILYTQRSCRFYRVVVEFRGSLISTVLSTFVMQSLCVVYIELSTLNSK